MELAMIQDRIVPLNDVDNVYFDRGTFFGDGVYEVLRSYNGKLFALNEHMERFERSLKLIQIKGVDIDKVRADVEKIFAQSGISDAAIYFHITRGSAPREHCWNEDIKPNFFMTITPVTGYQKLRDNGAKVCLYKDSRWARCDIKSLNLLPNVIAKQYAHDKGCFEALLTDRRGDITEGSSSAFFAIFGNEVVTRPLSNKILPSVTRKFVARAVEICKMKLVEKIVNPFDLAKADEMFLAVTTKDIVGIVEFDGKAVSGGKIGQKTRMLQEAFAQIVQSGA